LTANLAQSPDGALQKCWVVFATINYRDTPSRIAVPRGTSIPTPSSTSDAGLANAVQGRDRSSSSEPRLWIPFDARFHSQDTLSRHLLFFNFQRASGVLRPLTRFLPLGSKRVSVRVEIVRLSNFGGA
jgi:hypothetical protein